MIPRQRVLESPKRLNLYSRRSGRLTQGQALALEQHSDHYLLCPGPRRINFEQVFGRAAPLVLEVGFGMGNALLSLASKQPEFNVIGMEIYRPGLGSAMHGAARQELQNLRLMEGDARQLLEAVFEPSQLRRINIFFPDPWPKRKHLKRRLIEPGFVELLTSRLEPGGHLNLATDWQPYAEWMLKVLEAEPGLRNREAPGRFAPRSTDRPVTKFEARGLKLGHSVWDLAYEAHAFAS